MLDFEATARGPGWIDEVARSVLPAQCSTNSRLVVGHHDWSAKYTRATASGIAVLYDGDAVFLDHGALIVGSAAAQFPVT